MTEVWSLELIAPEDVPERRVGGLNVPLRLALQAQTAGAHSVVVSSDQVKPLLQDRRLKLPVVSQPPTERVVRAASNLVVHPESMKRASTSPDTVELRDAALPASVPFGFDPILVRDARSARAAERALLRSLRKPQDGWTATWLNRYISLSITRWLARTSLHPNQVSIAILLVGLAGAWFASRGSYASLLIGAVLFQSQSILDGCDGELSRITYQKSLAGQWLDTIGDDLTNYGFFAGAAWGLHQASGHAYYLIAGAVVVSAGFLASGLEYRYLIRIGSGDLLMYPLSQGAGTKGGFVSAIQPLFKRDTFVFITLLAALVGFVGPMLVVFAAGAVGVAASVVATEIRMARQRPVKD